MKIYYKIIVSLCVWFYICGLYNALFNIEYSTKQLIAAIVVPPYTIYIGAKENLMYFVNLKNNIKVCHIKNGREICE